MESNFSLTIVIPFKGDFNKLLILLNSLNNQTCLPNTVILINTNNFFYFWRAAFLKYKKN